MHRTLREENACVEYLAKLEAGNYETYHSITVPSTEISLLLLHSFFFLFVVSFRL